MIFSECGDAIIANDDQMVALIMIDAIGPVNFHFDLERCPVAIHRHPLEGSPGGRGRRPIDCPHIEESGSIQISSPEHPPFGILMQEPIKRVPIPRHDGFGKARGDTPRPLGLLRIHAGVLALAVA